MSFTPLYPHLARLEYFLEDGSETFVKGNLVVLDGDGMLAECGADPVSIIGVAAQDASGTENTKIGVWRAEPGVVFSAICSTTTAQTQVGAKYGTADSSSVWKVDIAETGTPSVFVESIDPRKAVGTSGGRLNVTFLASVCQGTED